MTQVRKVYCTLLYGSRDLVKKGLAKLSLFLTQSLGILITYIDIGLFNVLMVNIFTHRFFLRTFRFKTIQLQLRLVTNSTKTPKV